MKQILILFIIFLNISNSSFSQNDNPSFEIKTTNYTVISTNGVNLRDTPSLKGNKISSIPFGEIVKVIDNQSYGIDTIGSKIFYCNVDSSSCPIPIIGNWVKVSFNNKIGFLYDAYIYEYTDYIHRSISNTSNFNKDFVLLFHGSWCNYNYWYDSNLNWYGMYSKNSKFYLKKIDVSFYRDRVNELTDMGISSNENKNLLFIIGSKNELKTDLRNGMYSRSFFSNNFNNFAELDYSMEENKPILELNIGKKAQKMNEIDDYTLYPSGVIWKGDIDGDNKNDYIIHYGEKEGRSILYLSTRLNNELIKPVSIFYSGYCC